MVMDIKIIKCSDDMIEKLGLFYDDCVLYMDNNNINYPKWTYKQYPTTHSVIDATKNGSQYYCTYNNEICAAFVLNSDPGGAYDKGDWKINLNQGEYLIIHALSVSHKFAHNGIASKIIDFCVNQAKSNGFKAVRVDVVPENIPAIKLYEKYGFTFAGNKDLLRGFEEIPTFCLYEYNF